MRVAFAGQGGSGKTTLSSLFVRHLAAQGWPVVAIDATASTTACPATTTACMEAMTCP